MAYQMKSKQELAANSRKWGKELAAMFKILMGLDNDSDPFNNIKANNALGIQRPRWNTPTTPTVK
jgi:hypothetical protein